MTRHAHGPLQALEHQEGAIREGLSPRPVAPLAAPDAKKVPPRQAETALAMPANDHRAGDSALDVGRAKVHLRHEQGPIDLLPPAVSLSGPVGSYFPLDSL
jgi:hypothetical protein